MEEYYRSFVMNPAKPKTTVTTHELDDENLSKEIISLAPTKAVQTKILKTKGYIFKCEGEVK